MFEDAKRLDSSHRPALMKLVNSIYENLNEEDLALRGYPDLRARPNSGSSMNVPLLNDPNADFVARTMYFSRFLTATEGIPKRAVYGIFNDSGELTGAMGVAVSDYWPTWVVSWILNSPERENSVADSVKMFYNIIELYKSHGMHEATWAMPKYRLRAWMRIKQTMESLVTELGMPLNEYEHMTEYVVPANTIPKYTFMANLLGDKTHPYDMYVRRIKFK